MNDNNTNIDIKSTTIQNPKVKFDNGDFNKDNLLALAESIEMDDEDKDQIYVNDKTIPGETT